ncbi:mandelate racemase/muconate lactonizing enzyme family protein [Blastopirellula sp. J2-11]|uniref:mandelate racemase/muconate lactonizing enzyme family protein n=1 Tax=Blastopirellula sp. J2-11 TaxID=2943192 RepID=UPI0021CABF44|nr:mandelate racemase/muconate lactonizing enzyme family protein [Blastopirellula sp. J2-11]UUO04377.1 mandelate racemase/muconate lactonizing enzyme family protein [Blastopirellula sp. J2-11]
MKITRIECHVLLVPEFNEEACSSAQDNIVVQIHTDEGLVGVGETDTNPWVARECIRALGTHCMGLGLEQMLIGENPLEPERIWQKLYSGSKMTGRRGAVICAMGAIDMALWDLRGKALGKPVYELLGGAAKEKITPYASLIPSGRTLDEYCEGLIQSAKQAQAIGFKAGKMEVCVTGPYSHNGIQADDQAIIDLVAACRKAVGPDFTMMVDVAYCWPDAQTALRVIEELAPYDLFFVETPIDIDDLEGYAYLSERSPVPIAAGEWQNTHWEFLDLADRGKIQVLQPDVGRVGGFSEIRKVIDIAEQRDLLIVPHCWKSGIGIAASAHLAAATACCPFIEYLPESLCESVLRKELVSSGVRMENGFIPLPEQPGLGIELNMDAIERYSVDDVRGRGELTAAPFH